MVNPSGNFMTPSYLHRAWFRKIISRIFSYSFHNHLHISTTSAQAKPVFNLHAQLLLMQIHSSKLTSAPVIPQNTQFLDWFPFYVHRFIGDARYRKLADYQQAWYWNLLFESWVSERPGYLPDDGQLWRLANARTRQFFEKECEPVLSMFEREGSTADGGVWIYNRVLIKILDEQLLKFHRKMKKSNKSTNSGNTSYLDFEGIVKKENGSQRCATHPQSGLTEWGTCWGCYRERCAQVS
jgi:hypothetical protein